MRGTRARIASNGIEILLFCAQIHVRMHFFVLHFFLVIYCFQCRARHDMSNEWSSKIRSYEKMHRLSSPAFHIHSQRQTQRTVTLTTYGLVEWNNSILRSHRALDDWQNAKFPNAVERDTRSNWTFITIRGWHAAVFYCFVAAPHVCVRNVPLTQNVVFLSGIRNVAAICIGLVCNAIDRHGEHLHMDLRASWP